MPVHVQPRTAGPLALAVAALSTSAALAQPPGAQAERYLRLSNPHDWTLQIRLVVKAYQDLRENRLEFETFEFPALSVVFPVLDRSAAHKVHREGVRGVLQIDDRPVDDSMTLLTSLPGDVPYHSGTRLGRWETVNARGREVELDLTIPMTCYRTTFDETAAREVAWPTGPWPPEARSTFEPQMFVDLDFEGRPYDMAPVRDLVRRWTKGNARSVPPVVAAKWLTGMVQEHFQPREQGLAWSRVGQLEGVDLMGAAEAARRGRGSEFDMVVLLTAVLREAGIPARVVIGFDRSEERDRDQFLARARGRSRLHAWVEFALFDEPTNTLVWVPVDVLRLRRTSSRMRPLDQDWPYFGTHRELDAMMPFAFGFHPPTSVIAYGTPGFWGWSISGAEPPRRVFQGLSFSAITTPARGGQRRGGD